MRLRRLAVCAATLSFIVPQAGVAANTAPAATKTAIAPLTPAALQRNAAIAALRKRVKYVFVLYQENRSFDSYFGTFPGADGIYSRPPSQTPGFAQPLLDVDGSATTISPFRIGPKEFASDTDDVNHSHAGLIAKVDVTGGGPQMDRFALVEQQLHATAPYTPLQAKQFGELTMAYEDCDTIPLLWNYANRFVLYDHVFQSNLGPSTPGNLSILGAQAGETQFGLHPNEAYTGNGNSGPGLPVTNDANPHWGPGAGTQLNLTYATLPVTLAGGSIGTIAATDPLRASDFADMTSDVPFLAKQDKVPLGWGWYENGYVSPTQSTAAYIAHHNGPQYFGYLANSVERSNFHGLPNFTADVEQGALPQQGGVFYVKGGYTNILGLKPADPSAAVQSAFLGDDDHPGYSDAQISEAQVASAVNAISRSRYWPQSAIVIAWDDSEGDYDHVRPPLVAIGPGTGNAPADFLGDGPRVPLIVISPFAKTHYVDHRYGTQGSVVKLVDAVFDLTPLAELPDEVRGAGGAASVGKVGYVPEDGATSGVDELLDAFDRGRLAGRVAPLPREYAYVPRYFIAHLPQQTHLGCANIGIIPVDYMRGVANRIPADFSPRPIEDAAKTNAQHARTLVEHEKDPDD